MVQEEGWVVLLFLASKSHLPLFKIWQSFQSIRHKVYTNLIRSSLPDQNPSCVTSLNPTLSLQLHIRHFCKSGALNDYEISYRITRSLLIPLLLGLR